MKNIALIISYKGTNYHGFQMQPNVPTIQKALLNSIKKATGYDVIISGAGRTDAGVHAKFYLVNFHANTKIPLIKLPLALNAYLPDDIVIKSAFHVPLDFDSRFSCIKKEYTYNIYPSNTPNPFYDEYSYFCKTKLDIDKMISVSKHFIGMHDFNSMKAICPPISSTVRTIYSLDVYKKGDFIKIKICGDGFLYNMVRIISGTILRIGEGKLSNVDEILKTLDRRCAGPTLPPNGLFMTKLWYDDFTIGD